MKDITITFDPAGFFYITEEDLGNLRMRNIISKVNGEVVKFDLTSIDFRVYNPEAELQRIQDQKTELDAKEATVTAEVDAIAVIKAADITPISEPPIETTP